MLVWWLLLRMLHIVHFSRVLRMLLPLWCRRRNRLCVHFHRQHACTRTCTPTCSNNNRDNNPTLPNPMHTTRGALLAQICPIHTLVSTQAGHGTMHTSDTTGTCTMQHFKVRP